MARRKVGDTMHLVLNFQMRILSIREFEWWVLQFFVWDFFFSFIKTQGQIVTMCRRQDSETPGLMFDYCVTCVAPLHVKEECGSCQGMLLLALWICCAVGNIFNAMPNFPFKKRSSSCYFLR